MITIADCMVDLNGKGKQPLAISLEELTHRKDRKQKLALIKHIDVKTSELQPGDHRDIEGVGRCAILGGIAGGFRINLLEFRLSV